MIVYNTFKLLHTIHMNSSVIMAICIFCHVLSTNSTLHGTLHLHTEVNKSQLLENCPSTRQLQLIFIV